MFSKPGSAFTASSPVKIHDLTRFTIYIDVVTFSDGLSSFEKIFSYAQNQANANFIVGQWKDGVGLHLKADGRAQDIHFGEYGVLGINERIRCMMSFNGQVLQMFVNGENRAEENRGPLAFKSWHDAYPLVTGTDAVGASQWKGTIYELAIYDRALTSDEVKGLSSPSSLSGLSGRKEGKSKSEIAAQPSACSQ